MTELNNITGFFCQICGDNNLIDRTDVEEGRLNKNIAKALGIIDENGNYTATTYTQEQFESNASIDDILTKARIQGDMVRASKNNANNKKVNENGSKAVSQEKYTYQPGNNPIEGTLIKYEDGTLEFIDRTDAMFGYSAKFKNEEDLKAKRPYQTVRATLQKNPKDGSIKKGTVTTNFEYYSNGKLKSEIQTNEKGVVIKELKKDEKGYTDSEKRYNDKGNLISSKEGKWEDENTRITICKNDKGEQTQRQVIKVNRDKRVSSSIYNKNDILVSEMQYDEDGKNKKLSDYRSDGSLQKEVEYMNGGKGVQSESIYDSKGNLIQKYTADFIPDGKTWDKPSAQMLQGDCYLLSSINAIRELDNGDKILSDLIDINTDENGKKTYTVTLPGAKVAAESLKKDGLKVAITGTYTFTEEEFEKIAKKQGTKYSIGNANVILLEAAFEKYRQEVRQTVKDNNIRLSDETEGTVGLEGASGKLNGGLAYDATFVLTAKNSGVYMVESTGRGLDNDALKDGRVVISGNNRDGLIEAGVSSMEGGKYTTEQAELNDMLNKIMNDIKDGKKDIIATAGFKIYENGKESGGHAFTIKEVTEDSVTLINPWFPERTITMSRDDFLKTATKLAISDTSKESEIFEKNVNPNSGNEHSHTKRNEPTPERPVTDIDRKEVNDLVKRFFGGGKPVQSNGTAPSAKSKKAFDIMNRAITKSPVKSNPDNNTKQEPKLSQTEEEQTKKQLSDYIKRISQK